jgi:hypothetical protein
MNLRALAVPFVLRGLFARVLFRLRWRTLPCYLLLVNHYAFVVLN